MDQICTTISFVFHISVSLLALLFSCDMNYPTKNSYIDNNNDSIKIINMTTLKCRVVPLLFKKTCVCPAIEPNCLTEVREHEMYFCLVFIEHYVIHFLACYSLFTPHSWFHSGIGKMNLNNVKVPKMPGGGAASALIKLGLVAGIGVYGVANSLYNVDGGHRAIVFNRVGGIKDKVFSCLYSYSNELDSVWCLSHDSMVLKVYNANWIFPV